MLITMRFAQSTPISTVGKWIEARMVRVFFFIPCGFFNKVIKYRNKMSKKNISNNKLKCLPPPQKKPKK